MSNGFGVPQPVINTDKTWEKEVRLKDGDKVQLVPLHGLNECLTVFVHGKTIKTNGGFRWVPSGSRNEHLLNAVINDPFDQHPDEDMRKAFPKRFMLVYVLKATGKSAALMGKVGFLEVKSKNTFSTLRDWEKAQEDLGITGKDVTNQLVLINRQGSGQKNTEYQTTVIGSAPEVSFDPAEVEKLKEYLIGLYVKPVTEAWLKDLYQKAFVSGSGPLSHEQAENVPDVESEPDIQF